MSKIKPAFIAMACILCFACGDKTKVDFSIVPVKGSNGEYQYIDVSQKGKIVINPQFSEATIFRDGLAVIKTRSEDGKWGYIDKKGKFIVPPVYSYAQTFGDGVAWVQMEDQPPMLIDKKGKMVLQIDSLISANPFNHGVSKIEVYSKGEELTMLINKKGEPIVATVVGEEIDNINDGIYSFKNKKSEKWGYKNENGEIAINPQFDIVRPFFDGMAVVKVGEKWGAVDEKGNIIINPQYDNLIYDSDGLFRAIIGKKWGWINKKGEIVINPQFDGATGYHGSKLAPVEMGGKYGYIDKKGQIVINPQFNDAKPFNGDYALVVSGDKMGFINKKGDFVVQPLYDEDIMNSIEYYSASEQNAHDFPPSLQVHLVGEGQNFLPYERLKEKRRELEEEEKKKARSQTLYLSGSQWGDPNTFNPLVEPWLVAWPVNDRFNIMYEPLTAYNSLTGAMEPILGTLVSYNAEKVVVDIQPEAKWSDGVPVTSVDVKFIYELGKRFPQAPINYVGEFVSEIKVDTIDGKERLSFMVDKAKRNNPLVILDQLQAIRIIPAHVFGKYLEENNGDFDAVKKIKCDNNPVVSGPYTIKYYNNERIILERRDDYWGNKVLHGGELPAPKYIIHPIYKNNDYFAINLQKGALDASMNYIPRINDKKKDGVNTWYDSPPYFVPSSMHFLYLNNTKAPLNDKHFRRAMAAAIDYTAISRHALSNYAPKMKPGLIMSVGLEKKYYNEEEVNKHSVPLGDKEYAKKVLKEAGYKPFFDEKGSLKYTIGPNGDALPTLSIKSPAGWSDWEAIVNLLVKQLREVGIDVREDFVDGSQYWPALPSGEFDIIMRKPPVAVTASLPWNRFNAVMSSRNWRPTGNGNFMNENEGRYNNPNAYDYNKRVDELLGLIPLLSKEEEIKSAYIELNNIFLDNQPVIPICHLPEEYYQFSTKAWTGWPTEKNPYAPPQLPWIGSGINILWRLKPL